MAGSVSRDRLDWSTVGTAAPPFPLDAVRIRLGGEQKTDGGAHEVSFDDLNTP